MYNNIYIYIYIYNMYNNIYIYIYICIYIYIYISDGWCTQKFTWKYFFPLKIYDMPLYVYIFPSVDLPRNSHFIKKLKKKQIGLLGHAYGRGVRWYMYMCHIIICICVTSSYVYVSHHHMYVCHIIICICVTSS